MSRAALLRWGPPLLWAATIFTLSAQSRLPQLPDLLGWDKLQHTAGYLVGGVLLGRALTGTKRGMLLAALLGLAYGASDEVHQLFVSGRNASALDWCADALGICLGIALWSITHHFARQKEQAAMTHA